MSDRQEKRAHFEEGKKRSPLLWLGIALVLVAAGAIAAWSSLGGADGKYPLVSAESGQVRLPLATVGDGRAHFYTFRQGDTAIDFFVLKSRDGVIRSAFDTCDVCYKAKKGYRQEGDMMVCNNCEQTFAADKINEIKGGCNPAPLKRQVVGDSLLIAAADIARGAWYFQGGR